MHALVDEFAASGELGVGAPFAVIALAPAVPIATADEHQGTELVRVNQFARFLQRRMVAMVIADAHPQGLVLRLRLKDAELPGVQRAWLLNQHMLAGLHRRQRNRRQRMALGIEHDDGINGGIGEGIIEIGDCPAPGCELRHAGRSGRIRIASISQNRPLHFFQARWRAFAR